MKNKVHLWTFRLTRSVNSDVEILRKEGRIVGTMIGKMRGMDVV